MESNKILAKVSTPATSKINWVNVISGVVAIAAAFGIIIPEQYQLIAAQILSILTPIVTIWLRSLMTAKQP